MRGQRTRIGDLVDGVLRRWNLERRTREHRAIGLWAELVGGKIARNTEPTAVRDRVLLVWAASHTWAQTLDLMKPRIMERLQERLGQDVVRDIHFSAGRSPKSRKPRARPAQPPPVVLSEEDQAGVEAAAAQVSDPELREHARRAFASLLEARRRLEQRGYRRCEQCRGVFRGKGRRCARCRSGRRPFGRP